MACKCKSMAVAITMLSAFLILFSPVLSDKTLQTYIVHVSSQKAAPFAESNDLTTFYHSFLPKTNSGELVTNRMVHTYRNVATGFAAKLSAEEVREMEKMDGFIRATPRTYVNLHTTYSPIMLGLQRDFGVWNSTNYGEGVIIGLLDTGITPGHPSFNDTDMPSPPAKWKGKCDVGVDMCNKKLIGARNFVSDSPGPPVDADGHGTHTSSTAAGNYVGGANVFGMAFGIAVGMAPLAHVAMYRVCTDEGCADDDILAAMDAAVEDGVDMLSLSLGGFSQDFYADNIAIGAFGAIQKGIFVSCSAGNSGPFNSTLSNEAPWVLTVGASTTDRHIIASVLLGNTYGHGFDGESVYQPSDFPSKTFLPLIDAGAGGNVTTSYCGPGSLDDLDVKGKVVLCTRGGGIERIAKGQTVKDAGGMAMILANDQLNGYSTLADAHVLPASHVSYDAGQQIKAYINSNSTPVATIEFYGTRMEDPKAPLVASFSSRGPSLASPGILKPDIIGPGVSILAAWPVSVDNFRNEVAPFNIISGTSMSCPHLAGIAALLKSKYPDWSPAAIKSAIMTTASTQNLGGQPIDDERYLPADIFATGAGQVSPPHAVDPGLIYDLQPNEYIPYLCGLGYSNQEIQLIVQSAVNCSSIVAIPEAQLNYPSFVIKLNGTETVSYTRTVTNVGAANSNYDSVLGSIPGVDISVTPASLSFSQVNQKKTYQISFTRSATPANSTYVQGCISWVSKSGTVRSPVSVMFA